MNVARVVRRVGVAVAATLVVALGGPVAVNAAATGHPVLGLRFEDALRGRVWSDVGAVATEFARQRAAATLELTAGPVTQRWTLADLGLVDAGDDVRAALLAAGRDRSFWADAVTQTRAVWGGESVAAPRDRLDLDRLATALASVANRVALAPQDAVVAFEDGHVVVHLDTPGLRLDEDAARAAVVEAVDTGATSVDLPTAPVPAAVTSSDLAGVAATLGAGVERPFVVAAGETRVTIAPDKVFAALPVTVDDAGAAVQVDAAGLATDVDALAAQVDRDPQLRIVMAGAVVAEGAEGLQLDRDAAAQAVLAELTARAAGGGSDVVTVPVTALPFETQEATPGAFTGDHAVHLTFDDGPGGHTERILDILKEKGAHATFYVVGTRAREHPEVVGRILAEGHRLGNHTLTHAKLTTVPPEQLAAEMRTGQEVLTEITGVRPTAFRPPYGAVNDAVRAAAAAEHLSVDLWTVDTEDWRNPGADVVRDRVLTQARPGSVVLLHVLNGSTVDAVAGIIDGLRAAGYAVD